MLMHSYRIRIGVEFGPLIFVANAGNGKRRTHHSVTVFVSNELKRSQQTLDMRDMTHLERSIARAGRNV